MPTSCRCRGLAGADPLPVGALAGWQASVRLAAARVLAGDAVVARKAKGTLALSDGTLRLEGVTAQLAGGALALRVSLDAAPPRRCWRCRAR